MMLVIELDMTLHHGETLTCTAYVEVTTVVVTILADLCQEVTISIQEVTIQEVTIQVTIQEVTIQGEVSFPELEAMGTGMEMLMVPGVAGLLVASHVEEDNRPEFALIHH